MTAAFYWVLNMSVSGILTGLVILLLRRIKQLPRRLVYGTWLLLLVRLWLPVSVSSPLSLQNLLSPYAVRTITVWQTEWQGVWVPKVAQEMTVTNFFQATDGYTYMAQGILVPTTYKTNVLAQVFAIGGIVWISVTALLLLGMSFLYWRHMGRMRCILRGATQVQKGVYHSSEVTVPAVYGILRPKILLPPDLADEHYIRLHEQVHVCRRDNLWRTVAIITACIHWFNPLVWLLLPRFFADMELACDERVIRKLNENERKSYASAVLNASEKQRLFSSGFGGTGTRKRIMFLLSYRRMTAVGILAAVSFITAVVVMLITNR